MWGAEASGLHVHRPQGAMAYSLYNMKRGSVSDPKSRSKQERVPRERRGRSENAISAVVEHSQIKSRFF